MKNKLFLILIQVNNISLIKAERNIDHHVVTNDTNKQNGLDHDHLRKLILEELRNLKGEI